MVSTKSKHKEDSGGKLRFAERIKQVSNLTTISTLVGGMSLVASVFTLLNVSRLIEVIISFSARLAFGVEIIGVVLTTVVIEAVIHWSKKKRTKR
jgi:hypothetical protein